MKISSFEIKAGKLFNCTYQLTRSSGPVFNGTALDPVTRFAAEGVWAPVAVEGANITECPANLRQEPATYELEGETALAMTDIYVTKWW